MGLLDIFTKPKPAPQPQQEIKLAPKPGILYFLRLRNINTGHDEILCFESDNYRRLYEADARAMGASWYIDIWETTAEERLQKALTDQREQIKASYERDLQNLRYKLHGLQIDNNSLKKRLSNTTYTADYNKLFEQCAQIQGDYKRLQQEHETLQQQYNELLQSKNETAQQLAKIENPQPEEPAQDDDTAQSLQGLHAQFAMILSCMDASKLDGIAKDYKRELKQIKGQLPLQGKLVLAILQKYISTH